MPHPWKFVRAGGFDQVEITSGADLASLSELDQKLWVALACPTTGIDFDKRTLALIDMDGDGRIRAPELLRAVEWACRVVRDPDDLTKSEGALALSSIDAEDDEGRLLLATAKALLKSLGKGDAKKISVEETGRALEAFSKERLNGDGVVPETATDDAALVAVIKDVLACSPSPAKDRSGADGVSKAAHDAFFEAVDAHAAWLAKGDDAAVRVLGAATDDAHAAYAKVRGKLADYFARARVAAYDPRALAAVNGEEKQYLELAAKDLDVTAAEVERLPIAQVTGDRPLSLAQGVNPAWTDRVADFRTKVVVPLLGEKASLTEADLRAVGAKLAAYSDWQATKAGASVEKLGAARVRELATGDARTKLAALIAADHAEEPKAKAIESVEKLVRLNRDLMTLVNNFVSFRDFYTRKGPAIFQIGTLFLDTRACELCVRVADGARHATMAPLSNSYLVYADVKNAKGETMQIAAAMTAGDVDNLMVGRNGVFYDRAGNDWDATVTRIVDNPISIRQAFWAPYKKALRAVESALNKRAADAAAASDAQLTSGAESVAAGTAPTTPAPSRFDIGTIAALGVAVGGITAALGALLSAFFGLGLWMPLGLIGLIACISGPSMAIAWLKLRRRNLGPLLDANGWAVNAQAKLNVPLGGSLTKERKLPAGSSLDLADPFAEKRRPWGLYLLVVVLVVGAAAWFVGRLDPYLPSAARASTVLGRPAVAAPAGATSSEPAPAPETGH